MPTASNGLEIRGLARQFQALFNFLLSSRPVPRKTRGMSTVVSVGIHESQFPEKVRRDLLQSLRAREVNHKFHYDSYKQTQQWLKLHQAYSPSRTDTDCATTYDQSFDAVSEQIHQRQLQLIGLGCGGGQKDTRLLRAFSGRGIQTSYTPVDVSTAMVLVAHQAARTAVPSDLCHPFVCDLLTANDLASCGAFRLHADTARIITFFGMIPNFEPALILPKLRSLLRPDDYLLFSANLAPGVDYTAGIRRILPLYDNPLTHEWLMTFLLDLGISPDDGELRFSVEESPLGPDLQRVVARFHFMSARQVTIDEESFDFKARDSIRVFFSYRHTPTKIKNLLQQHAIEVQEQWITASEEEGIFLCRAK